MPVPLCAGTFLFVYSFKKQQTMKSILLVLSIFALSILYLESTKKTAKYKNLYFETLRKDFKNTESYLIDTLDTLPNDSLVYRLRDINALLNE